MGVVGGFGALWKITADGEFADYVVNHQALPNFRILERNSPGKSY